MLEFFNDHTLISAIVALVAMAVVFGGLLGFAAVAFKVEGDPIVEQIDQLLPQTQCGQCGYPGCKPYAQAIAEGDEINKCPPGGESTIEWCSGGFPQVIVEGDDIFGDGVNFAAQLEGLAEPGSICISH